MKKYLKSVSAAIEKTSLSELEQAVEILSTVRDNEGKVFLVGNGGSAATASHFANDLLKMGKMRAFSIPDMAPAYLAFMNDEGVDAMFREVLRTLGDPLDALVVISCSGNSQNVIEAAKLAIDMNIYVIAITGPDTDSEITFLSPDVLIRAEVDEIKAIEDVHMAVCHAIAGALCAL